MHLLLYLSSALYGGGGGDDRYFGAVMIPTFLVRNDAI